MAEKQKRKTRLYQRSQVIKILNPNNPRREGSNRYHIFQALENNMTVDKFLALVSKFNGGTKDLQILINSGHIEVMHNPV